MSEAASFRYASRGRGSNPNSNNTGLGSAATIASPMHRRWKGDIITSALISYCQRWLLVRFGMEATLVIERGVDGRNRVALRLVEPTCIYEAEVASLNALRKRDPQAPMDRVLLLFERTA